MFFDNMKCKFYPISSKHAHLKFKTYAFHVKNISTISS